MTEFHGLYERYAQAVRRFALFLSGDAALADDITSETFVRAWTSTGAIRESTVKAYLFTIARHIYVDMLRRERRSAELNESIPDPRPNIHVQVEQATEHEHAIVISCLPIWETQERRTGRGRFSCVSWHQFIPAGCGTEFGKRISSACFLRWLLDAAQFPVG